MHPVRRVDDEALEAYLCISETEHFHLAASKLREKRVLLDPRASVFSLVSYTMYL